MAVTDNGAAGISVTGSWDATTATTDGSIDADPDTPGVQPATVNPRIPVLLDVQVCLAYSAGTQCTWSTSRTSVMRVPHAFADGFPTSEAGPGQVALFTGEFNTTATDAKVPGYTGDLSLSRSHSTYANNPAAAPSVVSGVFGPGWSASLDGSDAGSAGMVVVDSTRADGTIAFIDDDGSALVFTAPPGAGGSTRRAGATLTQGAYPAADEETGQSGVALTVSGATLRLTGDDGTVTIFEPATPALAPSVTAAGVFTPTTVTEPGGLSTFYTRDTTGRVTRILAPVPTGLPAAACPEGPVTGMAKGCRALAIGYGTGTDGTPAGQVKQVSALLYNPTPMATKDCAGAALSLGVGMAAVPVACYGYDAAKRLTTVTDPRTGLSTAYEYGSANELTKLTPPGLAPYTLGYSMLEGRLKLTTVRRPQPAPLGGTANLARVVYTVPTAGSGLPNLSSGGVAAWEQAKAPSYGAAVFGPDYPGGVSATGPASNSDWTYADLSYTNEAGYTINTASYGAGDWQVTSSDYDGRGNIIRALDAGATAAAKANPGWDRGQIDQLATQTVYNDDILGKDAAGKSVVLTPAGSLVTDTYAPTRDATLASGQVLPARPWTHTDYDQGAPNNGVNPATGAPYRLATTVTSNAVDSSNAALETPVTTTNSYDPVVINDANGWDLGTATTVTTAGIKHVTRYNAQGRTIETRQPLSAGADAGTTKTVYYTADGSASDAACPTKPEWAGLVCQTTPAAAPSTGPAMPDQASTGYSIWLAPTSTVETSGTATRTTTSSYDAAGRVVTAKTTSTIPASTPRPGSFTHYQAGTGLVDYTGNLNAAGTDADPAARTATGYDTWGRPVSYTNDHGEATSTGYDTAGRVARVTDAKGSVTTGYDGTDATGKTEHRGNLTRLSITRGGGAGNLTYTGAYDPDGHLVAQTMPGGITQTTTYDQGGQPVGLAYTGQVTPVTEATDPTTGEITYTPGTPDPHGSWMAWTQTNDIYGRVRRDYTGQGAAFDGVPGVSDPSDITAPSAGQALAYDRAYSYDGAGRLTQVADRTATHTGTTASPDTPASDTVPCTVRGYTFDANGRRTTLTTATATNGDCAAATAESTTSYGYDTADRPTTAASVNGATPSGAYTYDSFGRQTTLPAADAPDPAKGNITLGYDDNDLPHAITQNGTTTSYTLDSAGRRQTATTSGGVNGVTTTVRHFTDPSDNPAWIETTTGGTTTSTRYAENLGGDLGATISSDGTAQLPLATLHGDIVTTPDLPASQDEATPCTTIDGWADYTEYGTPHDPTATTAVAGTTAGYGWLGAKQRSTTTESAGLTLMGDRLYDATTGRFTTLDPEPGGNPNAYTYPTDPINQYDLDGHWGWSSVRSWWMRQRHLVGHLNMRKGRPAIHWKENGYRNRIEYDRHNRWHWNGAPRHHGSVRQGLRAYGSYLWRTHGRRIVRAVVRYSGSFARSNIWISVGYQSWRQQWYRPYRVSEM